MAFDEDFRAFAQAKENGGPKPAVAIFYD